MEHFVQDIFCVTPPYANCPERIKPLDFLAWAKTDLKGSDGRSIGNAVGNIKKAIHARLDEIISNIHVTYAKDWDPRASTDTKLSILRQLGQPYQSIVKLITDIRNRYEHQYVLPSLAQARAYFEIAELWLHDSCAKCDIGQIALVDIPLTGYGMNAVERGNTFTSLKFGSPRNVVFYWTPKKCIVRLNCDGKRETLPFRSLTWKEILEEEKRYFKRAISASGKSITNQASITYLFEKYERHLKRAALPFSV